MSFDRLAPHYSWMEWVLAGNKLQQCRVQWIGKVRGCRRILLAGEGHGRFLEIALTHFPEAEIVCVDASEKMIQAASSRCSAITVPHHRLQFVHGSLPDWQPALGAFDLIVTNFFFDCFRQEELGPIVKRLATGAAPKCQWLVTEFHQPASFWRGLRARCILGASYAFFRRATHISARRVPLYEKELQQAGFRLADRKQFDCGLLVADHFQRP